MRNQTLHCLLIAFGLGLVSAAYAADKLPLKIVLPEPGLVGTQPPITGVPNLVPSPKTPRGEVLVPAGTVLLSKGKKATSSDSDPVQGSLGLITDGDKSADEGYWVELAPGKQWVQIDLEKSADISTIVVWHFHSQERAYHGVIVQVSDDATFKTGVATVFNNDSGNTAGLGAGKDFPYVESFQGKLIEASGVKGRYVRLYSAGNTSNKMNHYIEVEVFGKPAA